MSNTYATNPIILESSKLELRASKEQKVSTCKYVRLNTQTNLGREIIRSVHLMLWHRIGELSSVDNL